MPFEIVHNDISRMRADAIVNTAPPVPGIGYGADAAIHKKAGPKLLEARKKIGRIPAGQAAVTPAFGLNARYVIHTVCPVWQNGRHGEEALLDSCYQNALRLAKETGCRSAAFPLLAAGNNGFPGPVALQAAVRAFSRFLMENEMQITLAVFSRDALALSERLLRDVESYIDAAFVRRQTLDEYGLAPAEAPDADAAIRNLREQERRQRMRETGLQAAAPPGGGWEAVCGQLDAGFSETLLRLIDRTGKKDAEIYKKANIDRRLFSKIRSSPDYRPSKTTALAFAIALELDLDETKDLLSRAGFTLSHSSRFDLIVEYFIQNKDYDIFHLNEVLFTFGQPLLGG